MEIDRHDRFDILAFNGNGERSFPHTFPLGGAKAL